MLAFGTGSFGAVRFFLPRTTAIWKFEMQMQPATVGHNRSSKMLPQTGRSDERGPGGIVRPVAVVALRKVHKAVSPPSAAHHSKYLPAATYLTGNSSCFFRNSIMY